MHWDRFADPLLRTCGTLLESWRIENDAASSVWCFLIAPHNAPYCLLRADGHYAFRSTPLLSHPSIIPYIRQHIVLDITKPLVRSSASGVAPKITPGNSSQTFGEERTMPETRKPASEAPANKQKFSRRDFLVTGGDEVAVDALIATTSATAAVLPDPLAATPAKAPYPASTGYLVYDSK